MESMGAKPTQPLAVNVNEFLLGAQLCPCVVCAAHGERVY